jgi:hypothetical protein
VLLDEHEWARPLHKLDMFGVPYLVQGSWVIQHLDLYHGKTPMLCNSSFFKRIFGLDFEIIKLI